MSEKPSVKKELVAFYDKHYTDNAEHSDSRTRAKIARRVLNLLASGELGKEPLVLNIGSGGQVLESMLFKLAKRGTETRALRDAQFFTLDLAAIPKEKLRARHEPNVHHIVGDGEALQFPEGAISLAISNLAIDLMDKEALAEMAYVLKEGGKFVLMLHHPAFLRLLQRNPYVKPTLSHLAGVMIESDSIFHTKTQIRDRFAELGLTVRHIEQTGPLVPDESGQLRTEVSWWFVTGEKISNKQSEDKPALADNG